MRLKFVYMGHGYDQSRQTGPSSWSCPRRPRWTSRCGFWSRNCRRTRAVAGSCLVVVSGRHLGTIARHENIALAATDELMLIAPVAGG